MDKPFLTFKEQIARLEMKGISCKSKNEKIALVKKGYFNLVNGYKKPFVLNTNADRVHIYYPNTSIHMINNVFRFDRRLSALLLKNITHVEEELRNLTAYFFDLNNRIHTERWCDIEGYDPKIDANKISKLIEAINLEIQTAKESNNPYIKHYIQKESQIPTWIMIKVIKMTTFTKFIEYLKREVKRQLCDFYQIEHNESVNDFKILFSALNWIRKSRNACAHNERIIFLSDDNPAVITKYHHLLSNAYRQRNRSKQVVDLLIFLKYFNIRNDYKKLIRTILTELNQIKQVIESEVFEKIRVGLGIRHIQHMDIIVNDPKEIDYISLI